MKGGASVASKSFAWHHYRSATPSVLKDLEANFRFHHLDFDDIRVGEASISKIDYYKHYAFCAFHLPYKDASDRIHGAPLFVFLSKDALVTITPHPIPIIEDWFERLKDNTRLRAATIGKGPSFLLYRLLHEAFYQVVPILSELTQTASALEDRIGTGRDRRATVDLGRLRRNTLYLRHLIDPQRRMLGTLSSDRHPHIPSALRVYFEDLQDLFDLIGLTAENLNAIADGLFDVNESVLSHRTNRVITILTVVSASLMAPALIAGFYGMNVPWLPHIHDPWFIAFLLAASVVFVGGVVLIAGRRHRP